MVNRSEYGEWVLLGVTEENGDYRNVCIGDALAEGDKVRVIELDYVDELECWHWEELKTTFYWGLVIGAIGGVVAMLVLRAVGGV